MLTRKENTHPAPWRRVPDGGFLIGEPAYTNGVFWVARDFVDVDEGMATCWFVHRGDDDGEFVDSYDTLREAKALSR